MLPDEGVLYRLALEYASQGDLRAFLHRTGTGWPETTAWREIAGILQVLAKLHRGQRLRCSAGRDAGLKLMEIKRLRAKGHRITLLDEKRFWRLAGPRTRIS